MRLAQLGADVTIACRNPDKAFAALEDIKAQAPGAQVSQIEHIVRLQERALLYCCELSTTTRREEGCVPTPLSAAESRTILRDRRRLRRSSGVASGTVVDDTLPWLPPRLQLFLPLVSLCPVPVCFVSPFAIAIVL